MVRLKKEAKGAFITKRQMAVGKKIEMEHTDDPKIARRIASHHLEEHPKYYTELPKMERKLAMMEKKAKRNQK